MGRQLKLIWPIMLAIAIVSAVLMVVVFAIARLKGIDPDVLTRDTAATAGVPYYIGFLSDIGILLWGGTTAVCFFAAAAVTGGSGSRRLSAFLLASGAICLVLGLDDTFQLHNELPQLAGVPEASVFVAYAVIAGVDAWLFLSTIRKTEYALLVIAVAFFAVSVLLEAAVTPYYLQDGAKLVGQICLFVYFFRTGVSAARPPRDVGTSATG